MKIELIITSDTGRVAKMTVEVDARAFRYNRLVLASTLAAMLDEDAMDFPHSGRGGGSQ